MEGAPFSRSYLVPGQRVGRFDLHDAPPVRYLAETPDHAIAETLSAFRGTGFVESYLRKEGRPVALVEITLAASLVARIPDCTDPRILSALGLRPDQLAHHDRTLTQSVARALHSRGTATAGPAGLRWWSALTGAWHTTVVFTDHERVGEVSFGAPRILRPSDPVLGTALTVLGIRRR
jgi:hypothetical protein